MRLPFQFAELDPQVGREIVYHHASDGFPIGGVLYTPPRGEPSVAVLLMHPRGDFSRHYLAPLLALGGYACFGATTRYLNNDADALHERLLLDVAGSVSWLKERGYSKVILLGNSGGASLFAYYQAQAELPPAERYRESPSGDRAPLGDCELPAADGLFMLAAHRGEGVFLLERLDPSIVDEDDPLSVDCSLDMYDPKNGYRPMAQGPSRYSPDFLAAFRAGQRARCERLDARAREWTEAARAARKLMKDPEALLRLEPAARAHAARQSLTRRYQLIYRTLADPRYLDPTLDPSPRPLGSIFSFGRDPVLGNYGEGLARVMSARGWLSTWSGLSSRADLTQNLPRLSCPVHLCQPPADVEIYPSESAELFAAVKSEDRSQSELPHADHYLNPLGEEGQRLPNPRRRVADEVLLPWLRARWPV